MKLWTELHRRRHPKRRAAVDINVSLSLSLFPVPGSSSFFLCLAVSLSLCLFGGSFRALCQGNSLSLVSEKLPAQLSPAQTAGHRMGTMKAAPLTPARTNTCTVLISQTQHDSETTTCTKNKNDDIAPCSSSTPPPSPASFFFPSPPPSSSPSAALIEVKESRGT